MVTVKTFKAYFLHLHLHAIGITLLGSLPLSFICLFCRAMMPFLFWSIFQFLFTFYLHILFRSNGLCVLCVWVCAYGQAPLAQRNQWRCSRWFEAWFVSFFSVAVECGPVGCSVLCGGVFEASERKDIAEAAKAIEGCSIQGAFCNANIFKPAITIKHAWSRTKILSILVFRFPVLMVWCSFLYCYEYGTVYTYFGLVLLLPGPCAHQLESNLLPAGTADKGKEKQTKPAPPTTIGFLRILFPSWLEFKLLKLHLFEVIMKFQRAVKGTTLLRLLWNKLKQDIK